MSCAMVLNSIMEPVTGGNGVCAPGVEAAKVVVKYYDIFLMFIYISFDIKRFKIPCVYRYGKFFCVRRE